MLDNITKRRIDDCRDILVGKLPDPKSQIEQITIALIYKFMDDMDKEAIELGGKAKFFSDYNIPDPNDPKKEILVPFEKYSWDNLFDTKVSAAKMLKLYSEAIEGMVKNPNIPELFANIFKNAYLPYRDPETLKMFLKTISEFEYTHSEKLGDAFEYLLSVMGSQGDAGQFRTPRHIIDFLVAIVDPGKDDTILDPACGTAGFLISAFKYIKEQNNNKLTPDEQKRLIKNFVGYDISPDMVRLSLVNLYLHGFSDPHVYEYDSLSSEDRWNETFDVVLANPPFMSPKGGIRPHKKFTISSNRSEVLFVDYIAEHLNPKGRAGIIVPEGIIFQSGTAYKALRKMLVDKYLYAVVSLPAGVFNPYSGVKTSILLMDADLAKKTKDILFVKIDNDGYGLGAQRNAVKGGQLEEAVATLKTFRQNCIEGKPFENTTLAQAVSKTEIGKSGDYNLSGGRYISNLEVSTEYEKVKLEDILDYEQPTNYIVSSTEYNDKFKTPVLTAGKSFILGFTDEEKGIFKKDLPVIIFDDFTTATKYVDFPFKVKSSAMKILKVKKEKANILFLYHLIQNIKFDSSDHKRYWISQYSQIKVPLPPLTVQEEIVSEIESYQKIIDGARMVVDNYKPRIEIDNDWEMVELNTICEVKDGTHDSPKYVLNDGIPFITQKNITKEGLSFENVNYISEEDHLKIIKRSNVEFGDIIFSMIGANRGMSCIIDDERIFSIKNVGLIKTKNLINQKFLLYYLQSQNAQNHVALMSTGGAQEFISLKTLRSFPIPLPSNEIQHQIVEQIENEQALVNANKELIAIYEQKIKDRIGKVWGEKEQKTVSKKLSNDLYLAMMLKQMEKKIQLNYGEVATQKTVFHLNTFTNQKLDYPFMNSNYGTYSYQLKDDLVKNPYLSKTKRGSGEVFVVTSSKENEVVEALSNPENKEFVDAINEVLKIYQTPLINKETENIELLNTVSKVILDKQSKDLDIVYAGMQEWKIEQNGFTTKADKFKKPKTKKMIDLIVKLGLMEKLIHNE